MRALPADDKTPIRGIGARCCACAQAALKTNPRAIAKTPHHCRFWILNFRLSEEAKARFDKNSSISVEQSKRCTHSDVARLSVFRFSLISARFGNFPPHAPGSGLQYKWAVSTIAEQAFTDPGFKLPTSLVRKRHDIGSAGAGAF